MGSEWSESPAGPQGPAGPPGSRFLQHQIAEAAMTRYNGSAEAVVSNINIGAGVITTGEIIMAGYWYSVILHLPVRSTVAGDVALINVRRGTLVTSPLLAQRRVHLPTANTTFYVPLYAVYAPVADADSVFFCTTAQRASGSGTVSVVTSATEPAYMGISKMTVLSQSYD